jgi:alpha-mannosidase
MHACRFARLSLIAFAFSFSMQGQSFLQNRPQTNLSTAAQDKLETIASLTSLPAAEWHLHTGDLPHGESADASGWPVVTAPSKAAKDAVWYRRVIEVPKTLHGYDISGSRVLFQFRADANGPMPEIIYYNGRRVALGDDLEPIVLFENAHPGDKIDVAVKLLHTVDNKSFRGATLKIESEAAAETHNRPNPEDIRVECITAANLLPALPTPRRDLLPIVEKAVAAIDMNALKAADQARFDASLRQAQSILEPLRPVLAQVHLNLTGNSHIDAAWLWPWTETVDVVKRTFTSAVQLMNEYPDYTFTQSAAQYTAWMNEKYPSLNEEIQQRVKEGRWEIVGGMWIEPDLNMPDGETEVRELLIGQKYFKDTLGVTARIGWNPDSFGYNWQLPQIYKRSGLDYFVTQKMHWNDTNQLPLRIFWWQSPDGSKVLTYFPTDYAHTNLDPIRLSNDFAASAERNPGLTDMMDVFGVGDHGGGPTRAILDQGEHYIAATKDVNGKPERDLAMPTMRFGTAQHYFDTITPKLSSDSPVWNYDKIGTERYSIAATPGKISLPTWNDELYFEYHRGVFTSQAKHKANMRRSEVETIDAEKLASLAWLTGKPYPNDDFTDSWKKITFNTFHDLAAGSGIGVIYKDAQDDYKEVFHSDREITEDSLKVLSAGIDTHTKDGASVLIFNPLAWPRTETVEMTVQLPSAADSVRLLDTRNHEVLTQTVGHDAATNTFILLARPVDVPSLGYEVLHAVAGAAKEPASALKAAELKATERGDTIHLENEKLSVVIDRHTGCISSLTDAKTHTEFLAANSCGNQLQTFVDKPKNYDAWNVDPGTLDHFTPISNVDSIALTDQGPLRATVHIVRTWQASKFVQDISLDAGADSVDIRNHVDWHETHVLLKAAFPLSATSPKATYEIPYGSIERTTERNNSYQKAQFEVPAMRWADLGNSGHGVSILNDSKYGYDGLGNTLRLTLLRSPTWPDADADRGVQEFRYAIYPHAGTWKQSETMHRGYELNYPMSATQVESHTGSMPAERSWISVENPNVTLTSVKKAEDSDALVFRLVEWAGKASEVKLHVPTGATSATETNLMEKPMGQALPMQGDMVTVPITPYEILTVEAAYKPASK